MNKCLILVDNTNIYIGGQRHSAGRKGVNGHDGRHEARDPSWRLDFASLRTELAAGREVIESVMVGSSPPESESPWEEAAASAGFKVVVHETNHRNEEKAVDTELVARGTELIVSNGEPGVVILGSGDRDYVPLVEVAHRNRWEVELCAFKCTYPSDGELARAVDRIRPLDDCFEAIGHCEYDWPNASMG